MSKSIHEILWEALSEVAKEYGVAITGLAADWADTSSFAGTEFSLMRIVISNAKIFQPTSKG